MIEEEHDQNGLDEPGQKGSFSGMTLNRIVAILFVLGVYLIIFLKILILD